MGTGNSHVRARGAALVVVAMLALTVTACGSDDGDSESRPATSAATNAATGTDRQEIKSSVLAVQDAFYSGDGKRVCAELTPKARKEGETAGSHDTCEKNMSVLGKSSGFLRDRVSKIRSIEIDGDKAVVMTQIPGSGVPPAPVPYRKVGGEWKVESMAPPKPASVQ